MQELRVGHPISFSPPDIREEDIEAVVSVLRSGWITSGPVGTEFERELASFTGSGGVVLLNSCTAALEAALRVLDIGRGDEVIVSSYTYTASASVVAHVGANIVLVDTMPGSYVPSIDAIVEKITPRTKAVIVTDLAGVPYDTERLIAALDGIGVQSDNQILGALGRPAVIVDGAHSLGAVFNGYSAGSLGDFTAFSFHAVKNLTTSEGGCLAWRRGIPTDQEALSTRIRRNSLHGQTKDALAKMKAGAWEYDIVELGYKSNMPDILAALGLSQLRRYSSNLNRRRELVSIYETALDGVVQTLDHSGRDWQSSAHLYMLDLGSHADDRELIISQLADKGIATNVHYKPLPMLTAYKKLGFTGTDFPNAVNAFSRELTLPLHTQLTDEDALYVAGELRSLIA